MATANFTFTTLTGTETAGWNSINNLITSIDTQLNTSNRLIYMSGWSAVAGQTIKWDAANSRWVPGTLDAAALANNSVELGTKTTGDYVASITAAGTNEVSVTGTGEGAAATVRLANNTALRGAATVETPPTYSGGSTGTVGRVPDAKYVTDALAYATSGNVTLGGDVTGNASANTIANNAISQAKMADNSVGTAEIINANVTANKLSLPTGGALTLIDSQTFTSSTTYTMPTNAKIITIECVGAGGGGAGGGKGATTNNTNGGAGGGGGGYITLTVPSIAIASGGSSVTVTIGSGGLGGAGGTVTGASINPGNFGGTSTFGTYDFLGGLGGSPTGTPGWSGMQTFLPYSSSSTIPIGYGGFGFFSGPTQPALRNYLGGAGGGAGGGVEGSTAYAGGAGGASQNNLTTNIDTSSIYTFSMQTGGGASGGAVSSNGSNATTAKSGGGGGGGSRTTTAGAGGNGAVGGGGGGGGAANNGQNGGAGGNGGRAEITIRVYG